MRRTVMGGLLRGIPIVAGVVSIILAVPLPAAEGGDVAALLENLREGSLEQRRAALPALAELGDFSAVPDIAKALRDEDPAVRELSERALWVIWSRSGDVEVDALMRKGSILLSNGQVAESIPVWHAIIQRMPNFAEGYNKRATAYYHVGEYEKSLRDIDSTLARNPYHFGALSGAGLCMIGLERFEEAVRYFDRALTINPNMEGIVTLKNRIRRSLKKPTA